MAGAIAAKPFLLLSSFNRDGCGAMQARLRRLVAGMSTAVVGVDVRDGPSLAIFEARPIGKESQAGYAWSRAPAFLGRFGWESGRGDARRSGGAAGSRNSSLQGERIVDTAGGVGFDFPCLFAFNQAFFQWSKAIEKRPRRNLTIFVSVMRV